jgi:hypothetical protein
VTTFHFIRTYHRPIEFKDERGAGEEFMVHQPEDGAVPFRPAFLANGLAAVDWKVERPDET